MSQVLPPMNPGAPASGATGEVAAPAPTTSLSPNQRAWARFKRNRIGYVSLWVFLVLLVVTTFAELVSNDRPLVARYNGQWFAPIFHNPPEKTLGGDFGTPTDWNDPLVKREFAKPGNWALFTFNRNGASSVHYFQKAPNPAPPSAQNWLGTDATGQDVVARLLYGFRVSIWFALALTVTGTAIGIAAGALASGGAPFACVAAASSG